MSGAGPAPSDPPADVDSTLASISDRMAALSSCRTMNQPRTVDLQLLPSVMSAPRAKTALATRSSCRLAPIIALAGPIGPTPWIGPATLFRNLHHLPCCATVVALLS